MNLSEPTLRELHLGLLRCSAADYARAELWFFRTALACRADAGRRNRRERKRAIAMAELTFQWMCDDGDDLAGLGLAAVADEIVVAAGRKIRRGRRAHCRAGGLDIRLARKIRRAVEPRPRKGGNPHE